MAPLPETQNPFSTRFVKPGAIRYRFTELGQETSKDVAGATDVSSGSGLDDEAGREQRWKSLLDTLRASGWWGQIVGPHGTGKSTLLFELLARLDREGVVSAHFELHDGERRFPYSLARLLKSEPVPHLIVIDGFEQLRFWSRRQAVRWCRRRSVGLLVTTHTPFNFPTLLETEASIPLAESLVYHHLESVGSDVLIAPEEIQARFDASAGNVRELFFSLYDLIEQKRRRG